MEPSTWDKKEKVFFLFFWVIYTLSPFSSVEELIDSLNGDVPVETKEPTSSSLTEDKEAKLERRPSASSGE